MASIETQIKDCANSLGFSLVGIAPAENVSTFPQFADWLQKGLAGEMNYLHRHSEARKHPNSILANVRSIIMLALNYKPEAKPIPEAAHNIGKIARYALGLDYHEVLWKKLSDLLSKIQMIVPDCQGRGVVDTAPLLERDFARKAGLGWFGKNTMLLNKQLGSYFFLAALLVDIPLQPDEPFTANHCGTCTACLDACPTSAFSRPGVLDARRCISYLTIELKTTIPEEFRSAMGNWLFGCDVCQEVCPWNHKSPAGTEPAFFPHQELNLIHLEDLLKLDKTAFRQRFGPTALSRPKRAGLLRNAAIVLGNIGLESSLPALQMATEDEEPLVREAAWWAIQQINNRSLAANSKQIGNITE